MTQDKPCDDTHLVYGDEEWNNVNHWCVICYAFILFIWRLKYFHMCAIHQRAIEPPFEGTSRSHTVTGCQNVPSDFPWDRGIGCLVGLLMSNDVLYEQNLLTLFLGLTKILSNLFSSSWQSVAHTKLHIISIFQAPDICVYLSSFEVVIQIWMDNMLRRTLYRNNNFTDHAH